MTTDLPRRFACTAAMTPADVPPYTTRSYCGAGCGAGATRDTRDGDDRGNDHGFDSNGPPFPVGRTRPALRITR